ncbi:pyocin knob domain-containing protein [Weissella cibaria]|uniref:pyocin knob domain-containing protein n=1 Tax=Weissella cibaria TaxID=137591 RepID=UPI002A763F59|nr:pyocin knob domain-containing protein [Weissella cibaria]MDY2520546.1 pyocin knob domain-containing protein [Weissella cibaria]
MANKFTNFIFTTEGKDTITQVLAAKKVAADAQLSINTVYTFATKLSTSLVYTQISSLGPKQTKPVGTVTPQDNDTVEMRIQLDNADLTTGYNLQGVAIVGQYNGNNFVLGYINSNETTNIPPYDGTQVQTVALDVSFAISDSNIVTINTQTAGMLTVDDYNALVKLLETRVSPLATDSKVVHLKGNESISDVKRFRETIIGSVDGNAGTADYMNVHTISSDINLDSISRSGNYLSTSKTKTTSGKPNGTSEQYTLVVGGNIQLFNDMSTDALYLRNRIDSKTLTPWKKIVEDVDQTLNAKYNYAQLPTVNGSEVALQSDLAVESNSRSVADRDLKTSIALEAQTRSAADIAFGSSLAAEVAARSTADASATAAMTKEQAARSTADASITANLTTETSARSAADTNLQALYSGLNRNLNDEIGVRSAADNLLLGSTADLASQIAKERDNRVFNDNSLASDIASNATKRDELFGSMAASIAKNSAAINSVNAATMHLSGSETITGKKTFSAGISTTNLDVSGTTNLTTLNVTDPISGSLGVKIATFTDFAVVAKDMKQYSGRWLATSSNAILNGPTGTIDFNAYIEVAYTWSDAGIITVSNQGSNNWIGTVSSGVIRKWTLVANKSEVVQKTGDTMTGGLTGGTTTLPASGDLNDLTNTGKYYQNYSVNATKWSNRPSNAPNLAFGIDVTSNVDQALVTQVYYVHQNSRMWVRTLWQTSSGIQASQWTELANDEKVVHQSGEESIGGTKTFTAGPIVKQDTPGLWFNTTGSPDGNQQLIRLGSTGTMGENIGYFGTNQLAVFGGGEGAAALQKDIYTNGKAKGDLSFLDTTTESAALVGDGSVYIITHANNYQNGTYSGHSFIEFTSGGDILINGKSYDADSVHKSGNETVNGDKNFTGNMTGTTKINQILTSLNGNSVVSMRPDIQAYEYSSKGLTFRFSKIGATAFVNISGKVTEDITSEEVLMSFGDGSNAKAYASPYWAGGETTGYKGNAISLGQVGSLSIWDDGSIRISYRGPKIAKGTWVDGSINYLSNSPLPANTILNNS